MVHHARKRSDDFTALGVVGSHAAQPQAVFLRAVENRKLLLLDELVALAGAKTQRVAIALQSKEELGAATVFPFACVHRAASQADDDRQVLDAHRALKFARSTSSALEHGFLRQVLANERLFGTRTKFVEVAANPQRDLFRIQDFSSIERGAVLAASAAFDTRVGLERDDSRQILACVQS